DQSLRRLIKNIEQDIKDSEINKGIYQTGIKACNRLIANSNNLFKNHKDSLGYYLNAINMSGTIFVDNQEEYLTLRNSGFLELIEDDSLVTSIQKKYSHHSFYKSIENYIKDINDDLNDVTYSKTSFKAKGKSGVIGNYGSYIHSQNLTNYDLNIISRKKDMSIFYLEFIDSSIKSDQALIELIKMEIKKN
ncbi:MAG: hypothetical protein CMP73_05345, partial [Flavobacteriales bacterium]|nr:hypothetical protein [Flavobacteriales bacterium]